MQPTPEELNLPGVHVVEDERDVRDGMVCRFRLMQIPAVGYANGEDFLANWRPDMRGVVLMDIGLSPHGEGMSGDKVFERLLALRAHMPVIFLTYRGADVRLCAELVRRRHHVDYFGKMHPQDDVDARIRLFLQEEPSLYEKATAERWLLQVLAVDWTHAERVALDGALNGLSGADWEKEIGTKFRTLEFQRKHGLDKIPLLKAYSGPNAKTAKLAMMVAPLMERMGATGGPEGKYRLVHLAAIELAYRLRLLDSSQQVAIYNCLRGQLASPQDQEIVAGALRLMGIEDVAKLKELLKTAGQEMLAYMLQVLSASDHRWVRHWLSWVSTRPTVTKWEELPHVGVE